MKGGVGGVILPRDAGKGLNKIQRFYHKNTLAPLASGERPWACPRGKHLAVCVPLNPPGNPQREERHCAYLIEEVTETQSKVPRFTPLLRNKTKTWTTPGPTPTRQTIVITEATTKTGGSVYHISRGPGTGLGPILAATQRGLRYRKLYVTD